MTPRFPGHGDEQVTQRGRLGHGQYPESLHDGFQGRDGIHLRYDDLAAQPPGPGRHTPSAPAVAAHHHGFSRDQRIGGAEDAVERALPRAEPVVELVLGLRIVDRDDRKGQVAVPDHALKPVNARGRLFRSADDLAQLLAVVPMRRGNQVGPVVQQEIRLRIQYGVQVPAERAGVFPPFREYGHSVMHDQAGRHVVLRAQGIGCADDGLRAACLDRRDQVGRLGRNVQANADAQVAKGLFPRETVFYRTQDRHLAGVPCHARRAGLGEIGITDVRFHGYCHYGFRRIARQG